MSCTGIFVVSDDFLLVLRAIKSGEVAHMAFSVLCVGEQPAQCRRVEDKANIKESVRLLLMTFTVYSICPCYILSMFNVVSNTLEENISHTSAEVVHRQAIKVELWVPYMQLTGSLLHGAEGHGRHIA